MNTDIMGKKVVVQTTECGKFYIKAKLVMDPVTGSYDIRSTSAAEDVVEKKKFKTKNLNSNINGGNDSGSDATYETLGKRPMLPKVVRVNRKLVRVDSKSSSAIANPMSDNNNNNYNNNNNNASLSTAVDTAEIENGNGIHDMNKETDEPLFELSLGNNSEAFIMKKRVAFDGAESSTTAASDIDTDNEEIVPTSSFGLPNSLYMTYILILLGPFFIYSLLTSVGWWSEISLFFKVALLCVCAILYCEVIASIRKS